MYWHSIFPLCNSFPFPSFHIPSVNINMLSCFNFNTDLFPLRPIFCNYLCYCLLLKNFLRSYKLSLGIWNKTFFFVWQWRWRKARNVCLLKHSNLLTIQTAIPVCLDKYLFLLWRWFSVQCGRLGTGASHFSSMI